MSALTWLLAWPASAYVEVAGWFGWYRNQPRVDEKWAAGIRAAGEHRRAQNAVDDAAVADAYAALWTTQSGLKNVNTNPGSQKGNQ